MTLTAYKTVQKLHPVFTGVALLFLGMFCGCASRRGDLAVTGTEAPFPRHLWIEYLPEPDYAAHPERGTGRPTPMFSAWSDQRMHSDLQQMADAGMEVILIRMSPEEFAQRATFHRVMHFASLASSRQLAVAVYLTSKEALHLEYHNLQHWLAQYSYPSAPGIARYSGLPFVLIGGNITVDKLPQNEDTLQLLLCGQDCPVPPQASTAEGVAVINGICWIRAGASPRILHSSLRSAQRAGAQIIIVSSWNNHAEGTYVQPNSGDGSAYVEALRKL